MFRDRITDDSILQLIGIYDVFSAKVAAEIFEGVFCSGFSFAASSYCLLDIGFVNWRDISDFATKISACDTFHPQSVDVDDGFGDRLVAANMVKNLEANGLSAVMEEQRRPRKCGHFEGKELLSVDEYLVKLKHVLELTKSIFVIARTDTVNWKEGLDFAVCYADTGADSMMVEAIKDLRIVEELSSKVKMPVMVNQLSGGKSPNWRLNRLKDAGVSIVIYSTPCLFVASTQWNFILMR